MKDFKYRFVLYISVILLSAFLLSGCTKDNDSTENSEDTTSQQSSEEPTGEVKVVGNIPEEVVENLIEFSDGYLDVVATEIGELKSDYYLVEVTPDGYVKKEPIEEYLEEVQRDLDKNKIPYQSVSLILGFTHTYAEPGWERAYHVHVWAKFEGVPEYSLVTAKLVAPEDHPVMLK